MQFQNTLFMGVLGVVLDLSIFLIMGVMLAYLYQLFSQIPKVDPKHMPRGWGKEEEKEQTPVSIDSCWAIYYHIFTISDMVYIGLKIEFSPDYLTD